jgi:hypothetical protein
VRLVAQLLKSTCISGAVVLRFADFLAEKLAEKPIFNRKLKLFFIG